MEDRVPIDNESKGIVRRLLRRHLDGLPKHAEKFLDRAKAQGADFRYKARAGALRVARSIARSLPGYAREPWLLDLEQRTIVWRLFTSEEKGIFEPGSKGRTSPTSRLLTTRV